MSSYKYPLSYIQDNGVRCFIIYILMWDLKIIRCPMETVLDDKLNSVVSKWNRCHAHNKTKRV